MVDELSASTDAPMEGFFNGADVVFATLASSAAALGVPTEVLPFPLNRYPLLILRRLVRPLSFLSRHLLPERWPLLLLLFRPRLLLLSHPSSSPPVTPLQFYLKL